MEGVRIIQNEHFKETEREVKKSVYKLKEDCVHLLALQKGCESSNMHKSTAKYTILQSVYRNKLKPYAASVFGAAVCQ